LVSLEKEKISEALDESSSLMQGLREKQDAFTQEMDLLRFGLKPSAVYFNPTERCNLNCSYCYIPEDMRRNGGQMSEEDISIRHPREYFSRTLPEEASQMVFHGQDYAPQRGLCRYRKIQG
jgi:uncharacterized protein